MCAAQLDLRRPSPTGRRFEVCTQVVPLVAIVLPLEGLEIDQVISPTAGYRLDVVNLPTVRLEDSRPILGADCPT